MRIDIESKKARNFGAFVQRYTDIIKAKSLTKQRQFLQKRWKTALFLLSFLAGKMESFSRE